MKLKLKKNDFKKHYMIGIGGIGVGIFLELEGNETLGREESRGARLLNRRDYCKLHIILHYVQIFLEGDFKVMPIGKVGDDTFGKKLVAEMKAVGLDVSFVRVVKGKPTLQSFCYVYPDKSGGNITLRDSACDDLTIKDIVSIMPKLKKYRGDAVALIVPEVPLSTRKEFLKKAKEIDCFVAASFTAGEIKKAYEDAIFNNIDMLSLNYEEACALLGLELGHKGYSEEVIKGFIKKLQPYNPKMYIAITAGSKGSWLFDGQTLTYKPVFKVDVISTAGAGDAFFAGLIIGWLVGMSGNDMHLFASLMGAASVTSEHTIHPSLNRRGLLRFIKKFMPNNNELDAVKKFLLER